VEVVPRDSPLRVISAEDNRLQVYYGGDGDTLHSGQGWVSTADTTPAQAPRWVTTVGGAGLRSGSGSSAALAAWLPKQTALEVLEDLGKELHIFYLGDGRTRNTTEGFVDSAEVGADGAFLSAEQRGVRVLSQAEVAALQAGDGTWLKVPYRTQFDGSRSAEANCGPSSVGMALEFFHNVVPTPELRALANRLQHTSNPDTGVAIEFLQQMVQSYGLHAYDLYAGEKFKRWSLEDLRSHLRNGHPVIPQLRYRLMPGRQKSDYSEDHYVVITGMKGDDFIYNDSVDGDGPGYARVMSADTLQKAWGSSYFPFAAFAVAQ
jgi:hypothetical protein